MKKILLILISLISLIGAGSYCYYTRLSKSAYVHNTKQLSIVCTTTMITDLVKNIAGEHAIITGLMGPGVDPHLYRARESDLHTLTSAHIIFYNGLHLEGKMAEVFAHMQTQTKTVAISNCLAHDELRSTSFNNVYDPHIWSDVSLWIKAAQYVCNNLCTINPEHEKSFRKNTDRYIAELNELNTYIKKNIALIPESSRILITAHDAFGYFGRAYGITVIGLQGLSTETEPGTLDIYTLSQLIIQKKIRAVFTETSIPDRTMIAVQHAVNASGWALSLGKPLYSDALGNPDEQAGTYIGMMKYNIDAIVSSLSPHSEDAT